MTILLNLKYGYLNYIVCLFLSSGLVLSDEREHLDLEISSENTHKIDDKHLSSNQQVSSKESHQKPTTSSVERAVTPLTRWVEDIFQNTSIMKPSAFNRELTNRGLPEELKPAVSLRQAIKSALKINSGTVLSANKISQEGGVTYKIKILSKDGVVNIISVSAQGNTE